MAGELSRRSVMLAGASVAAGCAAAAQVSNANDAEAWRRIDAMLAQNGGRERWAEARTLYLVYRQFYAGDEPSFREERAWRDMRAPRERLEFLWPAQNGAPERRRGRGFADGQMWRRAEDGTVTPYNAQQTQEFFDFWPRDFYTMFARFARRDAGLTLRMAGDHRIESFDAGAPIGVWCIDGAGNLIGWDAPFNAQEQLSYLYGPPHAYGDVNYIGWGMSADGMFRFEYADVRLSRESMAQNLITDRSAAVVTPWR